MGKKAKAQSVEGAPEVATPVTASSTAGGFPLAATKVDPGLAALFAQSAGPVKEPELKPTYRQERKYNEVEEDEDEEEEVEDEDEEEEVEDEDGDEEEDIEMEDMEEEKRSRKRKRGAENEDLEAAYLQRLAREDDRESKKETEKPKRVKTTEDDKTEEEENEEEEVDEIPMHESLTNKKADPMDKASRTLFLSNVSTDAIKSKSAKKTLLAHLSSVLPKPSSTDPATVHKVESLRFRSTAFSSTALPRRAAYAKKELMDSTTKGTNAYVVARQTYTRRQRLEASAHRP
ncbi:nucleolar protein 12 [Microsporum canis CBS 113480]|uniref:Nucleolar protein 12 n=1 Tax=Arthroderma otae (strain ATCC MYA-4605 / CBS 113480) TaxID=554155 RepID=C5FX23_ARTOC|nr:nucleolar protein 12 [Microsporum canis CBS 113480]EEQ34863.1 nucleolar protein 12 [Microsporum canis CBS 113480]